MVEKWLLYSLACLMLWGAWGVVLKIAQRMLPVWYELYVSTNLAILVAILAVWAVYRHSINPTPTGLAVAIAAGALGTLGYVFLVLSLEAGGPASLVIPLTALYPAVTALLAVGLLGERVSAEQALGIVLAVLAIYLRSHSPG